MPLSDMAAIWAGSWCNFKTRLHNSDRAFAFKGMGIMTFKAHSYSTNLGLVLACSVMFGTIGPANAFQLAQNLANRTYVCDGGQENGGADYWFKANNTTIERADPRFSSTRVIFQLGSGHKGKLESHWSYETLSQKNGNRVMLYERLSLRSSVQTQHIYRTYELFRQSGKTHLTIYDGVNGARDWKMKVTRRCRAPGMSRRAYVVRKMPNSYWTPQN